MIKKIIILVFFMAYSMTVFSQGFANYNSFSFTGEEKLLLIDVDPITKADAFIRMDSLITYFNQTVNSIYTADAPILSNRTITFANGNVEWEGFDQDFKVSLFTSPEDLYFTLSPTNLSLNSTNGTDSTGMSFTPTYFQHIAEGEEGQISRLYGHANYLTLHHELSSGSSDFFVTRDSFGFVGANADMRFNGDPGTSGYGLISNGPNTLPSWQALSGDGNGIYSGTDTLQAGTTKVVMSGDNSKILQFEGLDGGAAEGYGNLFIRHSDGGAGIADPNGGNPFWGSVLQVDNVEGGNIMFGLREGYEGRISSGTNMFVEANTTMEIKSASGASYLTGSTASIVNAPSGYINITGGTGTRVGTSGGGAPNSSSVLDIVSTTKGFLPPRMTATQRDAISTPAEGLTVYNNVEKRLNIYNGSSWTNGVVHLDTLERLTNEMDFDSSAIYVKQIILDNTTTPTAETFLETDATAVAHGISLNKVIRMDATVVDGGSHYQLPYMPDFINASLIESVDGTNITSNVIASPTWTSSASLSIYIFYTK